MNMQTHTEGERERGGELKPDSVAERLCSKAVDWEVSGSILAMAILSLTGPLPRVIGKKPHAFVFCALVPL